VEESGGCGKNRHVVRSSNCDPNKSDFFLTTTYDDQNSKNWCADAIHETSRYSRHPTAPMKRLRFGRSRTSYALCWGGIEYRLRCSPVAAWCSTPSLWFIKIPQRLQKNGEGSCGNTSSDDHRPSGIASPLSIYEVHRISIVSRPHLHSLSFTDAGSTFVPTWLRMDET
jgi:hypothetical protein